MALSDYDTAAWDWDGKPCAGSFAAKNKAAVDIYKNKLYIRSEKEWVEGMSYIKPTIAELWAGTLSISGFSIEAIRGPQYSVFVFVRYHECVGKKYVTHVAGGIGAVGYTSVVPGVLKRAGVTGVAADPSEWVSGSESGGGKKTRHMISRIMKSGRIKNIYHNSHSRYVGVSKSTIREFFRWAKKQVENSAEGEAWLKKAKRNGLRFNQGDAYFARKVPAMKGIPATKAGKSKTPMLMKAIRGIGNEK